VQEKYGKNQCDDTSQIGGNKKLRHIPEKASDECEQES
jgi:hypothetical protein